MGQLSDEIMKACLVFPHGRKGPLHMTHIAEEKRWYSTCGFFGPLDAQCLGPSFEKTSRAHHNVL